MDRAHTYLGLSRCGKSPYNTGYLNLLDPYARHFLALKRQLDLCPPATIDQYRGIKALIGLTLERS
jgi:hypothetical protein